MLKKFLDYFIKITESKTTRIVLLFLFVFAGLFLSLQPAQAIFGFADFTITELASMQLDALDFIDSTVLQIIVMVGLIMTESIIFILASANILQWAMAIPIELGIGNPAQNYLVSSGWGFVVGLVNLSFVLIFVFMALSYILKIKIGNAEPKKILTNLIIVALLINFSLVFVGLIVDLADIFQTTLLKAFVGEEGNLVTLALEPLKANSMNVKRLLIAIPVGYLVTALIPYANVAALVAIGAFVLGEAMFGILSQTIVMIIFNFMIGGVLFFYAALFIIRVVMIWILAIMSPLAFISYALGLKKYWDEWLSLLTSWALLGVSALFFLGLGLKLFGAAVPPAQGFKIEDFTFPGFSFNYLFLLVYLVISLDFVKKSVPKYAEMLIGQGKVLAGSLKKVASTRTMQKRIWGPTAKTVAGGMGRMGGYLTGKAQTKLATAGTVGKLGWGVVRGLGKGIKAPTSSLIGYSAQQRRVDTPKSWDQMTIEDKVMYIKGLPQHREKIVLANKMKEEKTYQKSTDEEFKKEIRAIRDNLANDTLYAKEVGNLMDVEPDKVTFDLKLDSESLGLTGPKRADKRKGTTEDINEIIIEHIKPGVPALTRDEAAQVLHAQGLDSKNMAELSKSSIKSLPVQLALRKMGSSQLRALQNNFDEGTVHATLDDGRGLNTINEEEFKEIMRVNPRLVRWAFENPGGREMLNWSSKFHGFKKQTLGGGTPSGGTPGGGTPGGGTPGGGTPGWTASGGTSSGSTAPGGTSLGTPPVTPPPSGQPPGSSPTKKTPIHEKAEKKLEVVRFEKRELKKKRKELLEEKAKVEGTTIPTTPEYKKVERLTAELGRMDNILDTQIKREEKYLLGVMKNEGLKEIIANSANLDELYKVIRNSKGLQGSKQSYSPKKLEKTMRDVMAGKKSLNHVTRAGDLRRVFRKLMQLEKNKKS